MRQTLIAALWAYTFWYLGSAVAFAVGGSDLLGPTLGLVAGLAKIGYARQASWARFGRGT